MANTQNIAVGKPLVNGAIYIAETSVSAPTDAKTVLPIASWKSLGYISEDGLVNNNSPETDDIKDWNGDTVGTLNKEKTDTFKFTLLEVINEDVLKLVYGADNVSTSNGLTTVEANNNPLDEVSLAIDILMTPSKIKRIYIPKGKVTDIAEISYKGDSAVGYEITLTAFVSGGNTHIEFIENKPAA